MSLSAALKAGLGARDTKEKAGGGWDPYPGGTSQPASAAKVKPKTGQAKTGRRSLTEPRLNAGLAAGLSDTLPAPSPKLSPPPARPPANVNQQVEKSRRRNRATPDTVASQKAAWVDDGAKASRVNPQQYIRELDRFHAEQNRRLTQDVVMGVASQEIERIAQLAARVRGRYIAKLLDAGNTEKGGLKEAELAELRRHRESHEELCRGLDLLKGAIAEGDIAVTGMMRR